MVIINDKELRKDFPNFKGGEKELNAQMFFDGTNRILFAKLIPGASIGFHKHETNSEIIYILKGNAKFKYDEEVEYVSAGNIHYCPKGHSHEFINETDEDIEFIAVVPEQ